MELRRFTAEDFSAYAGAEEFPNGDMPFMGEVKMAEWYAFVLADNGGVAIDLYGEEDEPYGFWQQGFRFGEETESIVCYMAEKIDAKLEQFEDIDNVMSFLHGCTSFFYI